MLPKISGKSIVVVVLIGVGLLVIFWWMGKNPADQYLRKSISASILKDLVMLPITFWNPGPGSGEQILIISPNHR
jgi:hypothetical protein